MDLTDTDEEQVIDQEEATGTLYGIVGVEADATIQELHDSYLERWTHYRNDDNESATQKLLELVNAYVLLLDPQKRRDYDFTLRVKQRREQKQIERQEQLEKEQQKRKQAREEQQQQKPEYSFCPTNGMICIPCGYRIREHTYKSFFNVLGDHERRRHGKTDDEAREENIDRYETDIDEKIDIVAKLLISGQHAEAKSTYLGLIDGEEQDYCYCTKCNKLVIDKGKHHRKHKFQPGTSIYKRGIVSRHAVHYQPIIISIDDFSFDKKEYFSTYFFEGLHKRLKEHNYTYTPNSANTNPVLHVNDNSAGRIRVDHDNDQRKPPARKSNVKVTERRIPHFFKTVLSAKEKARWDKKHQCVDDEVNESDDSNDDDDEVNESDDSSDDDDEKKPRAMTTKKILPHVETQNEKKHAPDDDDDDYDDDSEMPCNII